MYYIHAYISWYLLGTAKSYDYLVPRNTTVKGKGKSDLHLSTIEHNNSQSMFTILAMNSMSLKSHFCIFVITGRIHD